MNRLTVGAAFGSLPDPDYAQAERRAEVFHLDDPADMEDELRERSENISAARDAAFEHGQDAYNEGDSREAAIILSKQMYDHPKLQGDWMDGWDTARMEDKS